MDVLTTLGIGRSHWVCYLAGTLASFFVVVFIWLLPPHKRGFLNGKRYHMPPGPKGSPVFGNLLPWLRDRQGGNLARWLLAQGQHGEMTTLSMGTKTWVLLNSGRVLKEIIAKRANITHERPFFPIASGLVSRNKRVFLFKTEDWREGRRLLHKLLMGAGSKLHGEVIENASLELLQAYIDEPEAWHAHNYRFTVEIMNQIVTGGTLSKSRKQLEDLQNVTSTFLTSINSSFVEFFPFLASLPRVLQIWRPHWENMGTFHYNVFKTWWQDMEKVKDSSAQASFVRDTVLEEFDASDEQRMYLTMLAIVAGADNPRMTMNAWVMACLSYPDVMLKVREEIDELCGPQGGRLPLLEDLPNLPYVCAVVKEVLRWRPTVPIVPQRVLVEDLEFEGYTFPAGTEFLVNTMAVCMNDYESPEKFMPERWLGEREPQEGIEQDLWQFAFSAGRRSCLGYKLAQKELFVSFARLLYCFDFVPRGEFNDKQLNAFSPGEPFPVKVTPRGESFVKLIIEGVV